MSEQQGPLMTPEFLRKAMVGAINNTWEGTMTPEVCMAVATAAQAFADLYKLEELEKRVAMLEKQLLLQSSSVSA